MVALLVTGHGNFATGLCSALNLIAGESEYILAVDFEAQEGTDDLMRNLEAAFDSLKEVKSIVVFADIAGGSPFNIASEFKYKHPDRNIEIVAGINLPMLIKAFTLMNVSKDALEMAEVLPETGRGQILRLELKEHKDDPEEDGI